MYSSPRPAAIKKNLRRHKEELKAEEFYDWALQGIMDMMLRDPYPITKEDFTTHVASGSPQYIEAGRRLNEMNYWSAPWKFNHFLKEPAAPVAPPREDYRPKWWERVLGWVADHTPNW